MTRYFRISKLIFLGLITFGFLAWSSEKNEDSQGNIRESPSEICRIAKHFPGGKYQFKSKSGIDEDSVDEEWLCAFDYKVDSGKNSFAVCPKLHGLSPSIE